MDDVIINEDDACWESKPTECGTKAARLWENNGHIFIFFADGEFLVEVFKDWFTWQLKGKNIMAFSTSPNLSEDGSRIMFKTESISQGTRDVQFGSETFNLPFIKLKKVEKITKLADEHVGVATMDIESLHSPGNLEPSILDSEDDNFWEPVKRDALKRVDVQFQMNIYQSWNFDFSFDQGDNGDQVELKCYNCGTRGYLLAKGHATFGVFAPNEQYIKIETWGVEAVINVYLRAKITETWGTHHPFITIVCAAVGVPGSLDIAPMIELGIGAEVIASSEWYIDLGVGVALEDSVVKICFNGCSSYGSG